MIYTRFGCLIYVLAILSAFASERVITRWNYDASSTFVQVVQASSFGDIFTLEQLDDGSAVISRVQLSDRQPIWSKRITGEASFRSLVMNAAENFLYFTGSPIPSLMVYGVMQVDVIDGNIVPIVSTTTVNSVYSRSESLIVPDLSGDSVYLLVFFNSNTPANTVLGKVVLLYLEFLGITINNYGIHTDIALISDSDMFISATNPITEDILFMRLSMTSLTTTTNSIIWDHARRGLSYSVCTKGLGRAIIDPSTIYHGFCFTYDSIDRININEYDINTGHVANPRIFLGIEGNHVYSMIRYSDDTSNDRIILTMEVQSALTIIIYSITNRDATALAVSTHPTSFVSALAFIAGDRLILLGVDQFQVPANNIFTTVMMEADSIFADVEYLHLFESKSLTLLTRSDPYLLSSALSSFSEYRVHTGAVGSIISTDATRTDDQGFNYSSDIVPKTDVQESLTLSFNKITQIPFELSISDLGYSSVIQSVGSSPPSWVWVDASTGTVMADTSQATIGTYYQFDVMISFPPSKWPYSTTVKIKVVEGEPEKITDKGIDGLGYEAAKGSEGQFGYTPSEENDLCVESEVSELAKIAQVISQGSSAVGIVIAGGISLMSLTSPASIWIMANQIQLYSLLLLTGSYISPNARIILTGNPSMSFSLSYVPIMQVPLLKILLEIFNFEQTNSSLQEIGIESGSVVITNILLLAVVLFIIVIHLLSFLLPKCRQTETDNCGTKLCKKLIMSIDMFLGFAVYVRLFIESYQALLLSSVDEINKIAITDEYSLTTPHIISASFAGAILIFGLLGNLFVLAIILKQNSESTFISRFNETFSGMKTDKLAKNYILMAMFVRKLLYISVMLALRSEMNTLSIMLGIAAVESLLIIYLLRVRPYVKLQDNLIEIINQIFFLSTVGLISFLKSPSSWNSTWETVIMYVVTGNNVLVSFVIVVFFIKIGYRKISYCLNQNKISSSESDKPMKIEQTQNSRVIESEISTPHSRIQVLEPETINNDKVSKLASFEQIGSLNKDAKIWPKIKQPPILHFNAGITDFEESKLPDPWEDRASPRFGDNRLKGIHY